MTTARAVAGVISLVLSSGCATPAADVPAGDAGDAGTAVPATSALEPCPEQTGTPSAGNALPALVFDCPGGGTLDLSRAPGVPTVVNLWGSWCTPCRDELPVLQEFADIADDRVRIVGVISKDGVPQAESFAADAGVTFPSAFDGEGNLMAELGLNVLPYTAFIAADGRLVHDELGPIGSVEELSGLVGEHLGVRL